MGFLIRDSAHHGMGVIRVRFLIRRVQAATAADPFAVVTRQSGEW